MSRLGHFINRKNELKSKNNKNNDFYSKFEQTGNLILKLNINQSKIITTPKIKI